MGVLPDFCPKTSKFGAFFAFVVLLLIFKDCKMYGFEVIFGNKTNFFNILFGSTTKTSYLCSVKKQKQQTILILILYGKNYFYR